MKNFKKLFAVIIAVMVVMSSMSTVLFGSLVSADTVESLSGEGTVEAPYQIGSVAELEWFRDDVNAGNTYSGKYVELTANINLSDIAWTPIGNSSEKFMGYFNGNDKTISNLTVETDSDYAGLFGYIKGNGMTADATPTVKNLKLTNVSVSGNYYVGGLSGQAYTCNVTNVHVEGEVSGVRYIGGVVGHVYTYFENCSFTGNASCSFDALGGIAGAGDCRAYNCSVIGDITGSNWVGGIVGNGQEGTSAVGCYVKGTVSTSSNFYRGVGGIAGVAGHGYASSEFKNNYFDGEVYLCGEKIDAVVMGIVNADVNDTAKITVEGNSWNTEYYPADLKVYVVAPEFSSDATTEDWVTNAVSTVERNNNLVMLESDLAYVDAESADDVVIMDFSTVTEEQVEEAIIANSTIALPAATVTDIPVKDLLTSKAPTLTFAKKFVADEATADTIAAYSDWYADFVLTINKDVTFNANGNADGYLAGQYDAWSENWVSVPFEDVTIKAGESLKIMEYAASLMGKPGLKITYNDVLTAVKEFDCGVFFTEEFLAANPDLEVELGLQIFNPENEEESFVIHPEETFLAENAIVYPDVPSATVTDLKAKDLPADTELTFAKKFVADEASPETIEAYKAWFSDFVLVVNKDVTFNANGTADGYLAGQYEAAFGDTWLKVPDCDVTLKANQPVKIMELAAELLGQSELKITYNDIVNFVKEFNCGVYFDEEFKAANPDVTVSLELQVFNPVYETESITIHEAELLDLSDAIIYNPEIGDVNADGKIDAADIALIRQALLGFVEADEYFNVNGDESFDVRDLVRIKKLAAHAEKVAAAEALAAALAEGGEVVLAEDIELPEGFTLTVPAGVTTTLDLNGYTLSQTTTQTTAHAMIYNKGTLTISDSIGTGKVSFADVTAYTADITWASNTIRNEGVLNINGGTIENITSEDVKNYSYPHAIDAYQGSVTNITGGTVKSANYDAIRMFCNSTTLATTVNISGGNIINRVSFQNPNNNTHTPGYGVLNITGGNFTTTDGVAANVRLLNFSRDYSNMKATITGGTFDKGIMTQDIANSGATTSEWATVTGGTFCVDPSAYVADGCKTVDNGDGTYTVISIADEVNVYGLNLKVVKDDNTHYGTITVSDKEGLLNLSKLDENWVELFSDGNGSQYSNYPIHNYYYRWTWDIVLTDDIDFGGATIEPIKLGQRLVFDGQGHTIKNAVIVTDSATENEAGLFVANNCGIKNLKLDNIQVTGSNVGNSTVGVLAGSCNCAIDNITITNSSATGGKYTGGVVGYGYTDITNCSLTNVTVKGGYKLGGLIGYICATSPNTGEVIGNTLTDCTVDGNDGIYAGGKDRYIIGKLVGNYNTDGTCKDNTIVNMTTSATENIGEIEAGKNVNQGALNVGNAEDLEAALNAGGDVVLTDDIAVSEIIVMNGGSLDGNGNTIDASDVLGSDCAITTAGGKVSNLTIVGDAYSTRAIGAGSSGDTVLTEDLIIDNVYLDNVLYGINGSGVEGTSVYVTNSTVYGWNSFSNIDLFSFENCTLGMGNCADGYFVVYGNTTFTNCTFEGVFDMGAREDNGVVWAAGKTVTFNDCYYDGVKVTAENFIEYFYYGAGDERDFGNLMRECTIIVDGVTVDNSAYL